ncbi:MAG: hypothetical protein AB7T06_40585 [Kofleriaceae bacterium]
MPTRWALLGLLLHSGCAVEERPDAPEVQLVMWPGQPLLDEYRAGVHAWSPLGFDLVDESALEECPRRWYDEPRETQCVITIGVKREPMLIERMGTGAYANRAERYMVIDDRVTNPLDLTTAAGHEAGCHILLDSPLHTVGGLCGGSSGTLTSVDLDHACATVGLCIDGRM